MTRGRTGRIGPLHLALVLGAAWWSWILLGLRPAPPPGPAGPIGRMAVAYQPVQSFAPPERPDARAIWSPVLFSLPTPAGFSREAPAGPAARPPLDPASDPPPLLDRAATRRMVAPATLPPVLLPPVPLSDPPARPAPPPASWVALAGEIPAGAGFPVPPGDRGASPWEAEAHVGFDSNGLPVHAFVESEDAPPAMRVAIARGLFRWRRPAGTAGWLVLRLVHPGGAAEDPVR